MTLKNVLITLASVAVVLGIILGLVAATGRNSWRDNVISLMSLVALVLGAAAHAVGWPIPRGGRSSARWLRTSDR